VELFLWPLYNYRMQMITRSDDRVNSIFAVPSRVKRYEHVVDGGDLLVIKCYRTNQARGPQGGMIKETTVIPKVVRREFHAMRSRLKSVGRGLFDNGSFELAIHRRIEPGELTVQAIGTPMMVRNILRTLTELGFSPNTRGSTWISKSKRKTLQGL
jgi:hypothetical protein